MFELRLLGGLSLEAGESLLAPGARQRRRLTLLAALALAGEHGISRESLQALLWPESSMERARHALDQLLYATRRDLGRHVVVSEGSDLRLNAAVVRPDLWTFHSAVREGRWADAADLYRGPLLHGHHLVGDVDFEYRIDAARARAERAYHSALEALAREAEARGDHIGAASWWRRRADSDPLAGSVAVALMRALAAAGDRAGALRHARVHQEHMRATLELEPDAAVVRLAEELTTGYAGASGDGARDERAEETSTRRAPMTPDAMPTFTVAPPGAAERESRGSRGTFGGPRVKSLPTGTGGVSIGLLAMVGVTLLLQPHMRATPTAPIDREAAPRARTAAVPSAVAPSAVAPSAAVRSLNAEATALALRARDQWNTRSKPGLERAVVLYRAASERDPLYAAPFTGLAESYVLLGYFGFEPADAMFPKAAAAARRALELDPRDGEALAAQGQVLAWQHRWDDAERAYRRALALAPRDATVHQWYALMLAYAGRTHEAAVHTGEAARLDPLSVQINNMYGVMLYQDGDLAGALRQYELTVQHEPDTAWVRRNPWVLANYAGVASEAHQYALALRLMQRALRIVPTHPRALMDLAAVYVAMHDTARARAVFARIDVRRPEYPIYCAEFHALLGETDAAFEWLDRVREWPLPALVSLNNSPHFARLRADRRFDRVRARLALPPLPRRD